MFSKLPVSLAWFALTAFIYLLQVIPFTGIFLMMLAAPFWSVITVNAGFGALAVEALVRPGYRLWLIAPLLYFGGYAYYAHLSHQEFARADAEIRSFNSGKVVAFDPAANNLVFQEKSQGLSGAALNFVRNYNLEVAYNANRNFKTAGHLAARIGRGSICEEIRKSSDARAAFIHAYGMKIDGKMSKTVCSITGPEDPVRPVVSVSSKRSKVKSWLLPATIDTITLRSPDYRTVELKSGYAAPLPWVPMPVMGCVLNSGAPSWDCFQGFSRLRQQGLGAPGTYGLANIEIVAKALGLTKMSNAELSGKAIAEVPAGLQANVGKRIEISLANLKKIIADPSERLTVHDIKGMRERLDLWSALVPAMTETLIRAVDGGARTRERAGMLQDLLNNLPASDYRPVGERILSALSARPELKRDFVRSTTLERLGELGLAALPVLEGRLFQRPGRLEKGAVLGLCRIGPPAARLADSIANTAIAPEAKHDRDTIFAVYVTLLRFGRLELAETVRAGSSLAKDLAATKIGSEITSASPSDVCIDRNDWQRRLRKSGS